MIKNVASRNIVTKQTEKMNQIILELQGEIGRLETILDTNQVNYRKNEMMSTWE